MYIPYLNNGKISYALDSRNIVTATIPAMALFYIIRYFFENAKEKTCTSKIIEQISLATFGIYLFHCLINYKTYLHLINIYTGSCCFIICAITTFVLRKIPIIKKLCNNERNMK